VSFILAAAGADLTVLRLRSPASGDGRPPRGGREDTTGGGGRGRRESTGVVEMGVVGTSLDQAAGQRDRLGCRCLSVPGGYYFVDPAHRSVIAFGS
jgi:hypothetical protein